MEHQIESLKKDINFTKFEQINHYSGILKEGIDARKEGLIWVIKVLWLLD